MTQRDPDIQKQDGKVTWTHRPGDEYLVTGKDVKGKRFRIRTSNWVHADGINLFNGSVYLIREGKRTLVKAVRN